MASQVQIISDAFVNLGKPPVNSPVTDNPIFDAASGIYTRLLPSILTLHSWRFAMKNLQLTKLTEDSPFDRWDDVFEMPADMLLAYRTEPILNFEIFDSKLYTNAQQVKLEYVFQASEATFPPYFTDLMVLKLTARIAMTVTQLGTLAKFWEKEAQQQLVTARALDSSIMPNPSVVRDALWETHVGAGGFGFRRSS